MTDEELQEMIDEADRDDDGEINEEELRFLRLVVSLLSSSVLRVSAVFPSCNRTCRLDCWQSYVFHWQVHAAHGRFNP